MIRTLVVFSMIFLFHSGSSSATLSGMTLLGQGEVKYMGFIKVYDAALYADTQLNGQGVMAADTSKCLQLTYDVSLTIKDFILGAETILSRQHSPEKIAEHRSEIDNLHGAYQDVQKGDHYTLCYNAPERRTTLALNDTVLVSVFSAEFADMYFGIWLGPIKPIDERLRDRLLMASGKGLAVK